jgi:hypothetical protein
MKAKAKFKIVQTEEDWFKLFRRGLFGWTFVDSGRRSDVERYLQLAIKGPELFDAAGSKIEVAQ